MDTDVLASPPASGVPVRARQSRMRPLHATLDAATAAQWFRLDPATGDIFWRDRPSQGVKAGDRAGALNSCSGGLQIRFRRRCYQASRLAYLLTHREWPPGNLNSDPRRAARGEPRWPRGKSPQRRGSGFCCAGRCPPQLATV